MFERIEKLIGITNLNKIKSKNILIVGIGGVGGVALECLVRSGVENITIIDFDTFEESNLNRQILSNNSNIGNKKTLEAVKRYKDINNNLNIKSLDLFIDKSNINTLEKYDYIIDACDSMEAKVELIKYSITNNINIISSMGMGNRLDPSKVYITKLSKTENDPLSKRLRNLLRKENITLNIPVVASKEVPLKSQLITSMISVPLAAGNLLAYYVINDIIKDN